MYTLYVHYVIATSKQLYCAFFLFKTFFIHGIKSSVYLYFKLVFVCAFENCHRYIFVLNSIDHNHKFHPNTVYMHLIIYINRLQFQFSLLRQVYKRCCTFDYVQIAFLPTGYYIKRHFVLPIQTRCKRHACFQRELMSRN